MQHYATEPHGTVPLRERRSDANKTFAGRGARKILTEPVELPMTPDRIDFSTAPADTQVVRSSFAARFARCTWCTRSPHMLERLFTCFI